MSDNVGTLLVFGASGDLASRLLLPALGQLLTRQPHRRIHLIGSGVQDWDRDRWREQVRQSFSAEDASGEAVDALLGDTEYIRADVTASDDLRKLLDACQGTPAIYFALPPAVTQKSCEQLASLTLPDGLQLALEKPFGTDLNSAEALNELVASLVPEDQIHRIDHFLGRSTVLNLLGLRFANRIFEPVWNSGEIERVDIIFDEELGLENRAGYYDKAGALVDMIQSHLLQVLSVVAMEPPATVTARDLRDAKAMVLRATHVWDDDAAKYSHRGRYTAGRVGDRDFPSYVDEPGVDASRNTETLAEVTFGIDNWHWQGVPFTLRSGKAISRNRYEIVIRFKPAQKVPTGLRGADVPTVLRLRLGPDQVSLEFNINGPGDPFEIEHEAIGAEFGPGQLLAYGEVLEGLLDADPTLSVRGDTAEDCWRIVAPVIQAWQNNEVSLDDYQAGSMGPSSWRPIGSPDSGGWQDSAGSAHAG